MSDQNVGLNAPVQKSDATPTKPTSSGKTSGNPLRPVSVPAASQASESHFHKWKSDDGEEHVFKSPDELDRFIREGTLRHKDYTKKTQELAEQRKQSEAERKRIEEQLTTASGMESKWKPIDEWLTRTPQGRAAYQYITTQMKGNIPPDAILEQSRASIEESINPLKSELEEIKKWREAQEQEKQFSSTMAALKERYPDMDEESVKTLYKQLDEAPEGDETRALLELIIKASKYSDSGAPARVPVTSGGSRPPRSDGVPEDIKKGTWNFEKARRLAKQQRGA